MKYALMFLTLCFLAQGAIALANASAVIQEQDDVRDIEFLIMNDSPMRWSSTSKKAAASILRLYNKKKTPITRKEEEKIIEYLLPNIDDIRWNIRHGTTGTDDRFRKVLRGCIEDFLRPRLDVVEDERKIANRVANIIIP